MIKLNSKGTAPDYTEHGSVSTDCKTVGELITDAAAIYGGCDLTIKVDGCRYELFDKTKIRFADETPIEEVTYVCSPGCITLIVKTNPKPNTVKKSGWVNIWISETDGLTHCGDNIYEDKSTAEHVGEYCGNNIATVRIEWEEVEQ